ncbi:ABC transporter substrate-binding protein [Streptomyces sp. URMC 123]|uniref:ABC transporter substrate-binding protein n=1 Tax=Streptomyces sp. URMC 123 TaxID=3423403 RepID=UPI003F1BC7C9
MTHPLPAPLPRRSLLRAALAGTGALALGACCVPGSGGGGAGNAAAGGPLITAPVTPAAVAERGPTTLRIVAEAGEREFLRAFVPEFEKAFPTVRVEVSTKAFADFAKTVVNTVSGADPPDLVQGNQGYGVDGPLIRAGLLRPLDDVAHAYGWDRDFPPGATGQLRWSQDGRIFGSGTLYGITQANEFVGVFSNTAKLDRLGLRPPRTYQEFVAAMERAKAAGEQPVMLGNADQYPAQQVLGLIQAQHVPVRETRAWISGVPGTTFASAGHRTAAATLRDWARRGWFGSGYNGVGADDAVTRFIGGKGVFLIAGAWHTPAVARGLGERVSLAVPLTADGRAACPGSLGLPWHITAGSPRTTAAVAFLGLMQSATGARVMAEVGRLPVRTQGVSVPGRAAREQLAAGRALLDDDGQTYYFDWSSTSMLSTIGSAGQELLDGRLGVDAFLAAVQKDWAAFHERRAAEAAGTGNGAGDGNRSGTDDGAETPR